LEFINEEYNNIENNLLNDEKYIKIIIKKMECLKSMGEWNKIFILSNKIWNNNSKIEIKKLLSPMISTTCFNLLKFDFLSETGIYYL
jgi:hypothetical protein